MSVSIKRPILSLLLISAAAATTLAQAQDNTRAQKAAAMLQQKFDAADTNHDGKLSPDEAKAGMPKIYENFAAVDADKDGYVTKAEIVQAMAAMKAKRDAGSN